MADVESDFEDWSATAGSNKPAGGTSIGTGLDDNLRQIQATIRQYLGHKGGDLASAGTVDLATATGFAVDITGTTTITALGTVSAGRSFLLQFDGALTFTHNGTSLIIPGGANITTAAGDMCLVVSEGSGNWRVAWYQRASGKVIIRGEVAQTVNTTDGAVATGTTVLPYDDTIPQITEGDEYMTRAITPTNASSTLKIDVVCHLSHSTNAQSMAAALFQDATANALASAVAAKVDQTNSRACVVFTHYMTAGTTSATTFRIRGGNNGAGTTTFNGSGGTRLHGGVLSSSITITEFLP
jgi:hypothetical protein